MFLPSRLVHFGAAVFVCVAIQSSPAAENPVDLVRLTDGHTISATIDGRTDGSHLWLTTWLGHGRISQAVPWQNVHEIEIGGRVVEAKIVRAAVETIRDRFPLSETEAVPTRGGKLDHELLAFSEPRGIPAISRMSTTSPPSVQAMSISTRLANWDQDVLVDGLEVELTTLDASGGPISCDGTAHFSLQLWKSLPHDLRMGTSSERWTRRVRREAFDSGSVVFRLPLATDQVQQSSDWWAYGTLQVRLVVPGSGVIERTISDLRLRPFEPMRDVQEQRTGMRRFPGEHPLRHAWQATQ